MFINVLFGYRAISQRKGITPVIAVVLLMMMTVAAAGMAYTWILGVQDMVTGVADEGIAEMVRATTTSISFEAVNNITKGSATDIGNIQVTLRNDGKYGYSESDLKQFVFYANKRIDTTATNEIAKCVDTVPNTIGNINVLGGICTINTSTAYPYKTGSDNGVLMEITTPFKDIRFKYMCVIIRAGRDYC